MSENKKIEQVPVVEQILASETESKPEQRVEQSVVQQKSEQVSPNQVVLPSDDSTTPLATIDDSIVLEQVESILAQGMDKVFLSMDATTQEAFKLKGEQTAKKITTLLQKGKIVINDIISIIMEWLRVVPSINQYYLEQEAKIKADLIIKMHKK